MRVVFLTREGAAPERLVCDVELFMDEAGPMEGMKVVGLSLWRTADGFNVTFPARSFGIGGERRFFDFLRAIEPGSNHVRRFREWIIAEYQNQSQQEIARN